MRFPPAGVNLISLAESFSHDLVVVVRKSRERGELLDGFLENILFKQ